MDALSRNDSSISEMDSAILELRQIGKLNDQNNDLENRTHCQSLRIIRIPEGAKNGKSTSIMASFFNKALGDLICLKSVSQRCNPRLIVLVTDVEIHLQH